MLARRGAFREIEVGLKTLTAIFIFLSASDPVAHAQPTAEEFVVYVESCGAFIEQCVSRNLIAPTDTHNENHRILERNGLLDAADWWAAIQSGSDGEMYDLMKGKWIKMPFSKENCDFVRSEQEKVFRSLSRHR